MQNWLVETESFSASFGGPIAVNEVERLVLSQIRRLLASPALVAETIIAARRQGETEDATLEEGDVIDALGAQPQR